MTRTAAPIDFQATLNPRQLEAVTHGTGPQLVLAGAGSGKTRVITYRVAWLVQEQGVDPSQIAAVTFTNKAAAEMRERIEEPTRREEALPSSSGSRTFHSFGVRFLRMYGQSRVDSATTVGSSIFDTDDQMRLVKRAMKGANLSADAFRPRAVLSAISSAKNQLVGPARYEQDADDFFTRRVAPVYTQYQALLREAGGVDFDDMIRLSVLLFQRNDPIRKRLRARYRYLLVDEFQDTNHAQMELIHELAGDAGGLTAVGDEDQGIYRWRGAELANILEFERSFPGATVRKLEQNYRSTQTILDASGAVVERNENRRGKTLWTDGDTGDKLVLFRGRDEQDEARWVANLLRGFHDDESLPYTDMAVLVRTNAQTRALEDAFLRNTIPYSLLAGVRFYERAEVKDLIAYLRLVRNPNDGLSFDRVLNRPARGIGKGTEKQLREIAEHARLTPWEALQKPELIDGIPARGRKALERFRDLMSDLVRLAEATPLPSLLRQILDATDFLAQFDPDDEDGQARRENIEELLSSAQEFTEKNAFGGETDDLVSAFLDHVALTSDTDGLGGPGVTLMTLHSAKGLEFDTVVVAGLEEGLLPHFNAQTHPDDLEEERRLLYVGMTRAERRLMLTTCKRRRVAGTYQDREESRFLSEIPGDHVVVENSPGALLLAAAELVAPVARAARPRRMSSTSSASRSPRADAEPPDPVEHRRPLPRWRCAYPSSRRLRAASR